MLHGRFYKRIAVDSPRSHCSIETRVTPMWSPRRPLPFARCSRCFGVGGSVGGSGWIVVFFSCEVVGVCVEKNGKFIAREKRLQVNNSFLHLNLLKRAG